MLILAGVALVVVGLGLLVADRLGLGRLPGDITFKGKNFSIHVPIVTSIVVSVVLTLLLNWWFGRSR